MKQSTAISLVLVGTVSAFMGYSALHRDDDDSWDPATQPSSHHTGSSYYGRHYSGGGGWSSGSSYSGTSRGGFGATGHAAGS